MGKLRVFGIVSVLMIGAAALFAGAHHYEDAVTAAILSLTLAVLAHLE